MAWSSSDRPEIGCVLSGGDDLIAKPVFPMDLAVKTMTHLLRRQLGINS